MNLGTHPNNPGLLYICLVPLMVKNLPLQICYAGDLGLIHGSGRFPGGGNGYPLQHSCLENPMVTLLHSWRSELQRGLFLERKRMCVLSRSVVSTSLQPHGLQPARLFCPWDSPGKNTGVGSPALLQGIFPSQGLNVGFLHCRRILYHLSHQGSPG